MPDPVYRNDHWASRPAYAALQLGPFVCALINETPPRLPMTQEVTPIDCLVVDGSELRWGEQGNWPVESADIVRQDGAIWLRLVPGEGARSIETAAVPLDTLQQILDDPVPDAVFGSLQLFELLVDRGALTRQCWWQDIEREGRFVGSGRSQETPACSKAAISGDSISNEMT